VAPDAVFELGSITKVVTGLWWHNGGTQRCRSFTAFIPETGQAVAAVANSAKPVEKAAKAAW
jgi:CubicO group peptidase (beta-lactamase class C family)